MIPILPDDIVRYIYMLRFEDDVKELAKLGTWWKFRVYNGNLRYAPKPHYDRTSARLFSTPSTRYFF